MIFKMSGCSIPLGIHNEQKNRFFRPCGLCAGQNCTLFMGKFSLRLIKWKVLDFRLSKFAGLKHSEDNEDNKHELHSKSISFSI